MARSFVDRQGVRLELGRELFRGGEGTIHEIAGHPRFLAKTYHSAPEADKAAKLAALVDARTDRLSGVAAWPVELFAERKGGPIRGLVMPRLDGYREIHLLYGPKSRLATFPLASWPFLIRTAANLARAFAELHDHGHVVGDVNDKVALVSKQALVKLIDCDGFQIRSGKGVYSCDVAVPTHQPPELQGMASFRGLKRTVDHDAFGLAVLVFQLLFLARHPYSGSYGGAGDMPLEKAIREHRFVYGAGAAARGMAPPPAALDLSIVSPDVAALFERAFAARKGSRPTAREWAQALDHLERGVKRCRSNPCHGRLGERPCPFCALERRTQSALFHLPMPARGARQGRTVAVNLPRLVKALAEVEAPEPAPALPDGFARACDEARHSFDQRAAARRRLVALTTAALLPAPFTRGVSLALLLGAPLLRRRPILARERAEHLLDLERRWREEADGRVYEREREALETARRTLDGLDRTHEARMVELEKNRERHQREAFLDRSPLAASRLRELGPSERTVLESYGIETAADVTAAALDGIPSLRPALARALLDWRRKLEAEFTFEPGAPVDPERLAALEHEIHHLRADLVQALADGPAHLRNAARKLRMRRHDLLREIRSVLAEPSARAAA